MASSRRPTTDPTGAAGLEDGADVAGGVGPPEDALGRRDEQPPGRGLGHRVRRAVPRDQVPRRREVVGGLERDDLDAGQGAFGEPAQGAGRRDLQERR